MWNSNPMRWSAAMMILLAPLALQGCSDDDDNITNPPASASTFVRLGHLSPDAPEVDIWVDGEVALEDVAFRDFSAYVELEAGNHRFQVSPANLEEPIVIDAQVELLEGKYYTIAATGRLADIQPVVMLDDVDSDDNNVKIRFVHAGPDAPEVDIALTDGSLLFSNVDFRDVEDVLTVPGGTYDLQVRLAGTETVALSFADVGLSPGTNYSIFATGLLADGTLSASVTVDSPGDGSTVVGLTPALAMLRVGHLSPDAPAVDISLDGEIVSSLTNVPFKAVSDYLQVSAATHSIQVFVAGTMTDPVIDASVTLLPGAAYTVAATGRVSETDLQPIVLLDDREGTGDGNARVRFAHMSPDAPEVDIMVADGPTLFANVEFRGTAGYSDVASGSYDLEARLSEGAALALSIPGVELAMSATYTVFAVGLVGNGSLEALLVKDSP